MKYEVSVANTSTANTANSLNNDKEKLKGTVSTRWSILIFVALNIILVIIAGVVYVGSPLFKNSQLCLTPECINTASRILNSLDLSKDPCTDFYAYACGGWIRRNRVPDWVASWDRLAYLRESLYQDMRDLLEVPNDSDGKEEPAGVKKARAFYRTCMNTDELEKKGLRPIQDILRSLGLPLSPLEHSVTTNTTFDWLFTMARARRLLGINIFYGLNVIEDVRNSSVNKIVLEQVSPGFGERYLLLPKKFGPEIKHYKHFITKMLHAYLNFTTPHNFTDVPKMAEDIIKFATQIAKVMSPSEVRRNSSYLFHEVLLTDLTKGPGVDNASWHQVNWTRYMNIVFNDTSVSLNFTKNTVILLDLPYMIKMSTLLQNTDPLTLQRFLWWNIFSATASLTMGKFRTLGFDFSRKIFGTQVQTPRWKTCTGNVNSNFGLALSYLYVREHFNSAHRKGALSMLKDIRAAFEVTVDQLDWMDEVTREKTLIKLHAIRAFVGYPAWIMNATELDKHYRKANVVDSDLFKTYMNLTNASIKRTLENMTKKPDRNRWVASATTANAFYSATLNSVTFPAGILQPPFYGNGIAALDYGSIGAIMGHEITHGFDDQGRRYDEHGNLKQWWSAATLKHYQERAQCINDQYNNYSMPDLGPTFNVHGFNTLGENIADNGGLRSAYDGYRIRERNRPMTYQRLPGLAELSTDQLFFLGFAQIWCGNSTLGAQKKLLVDGVHSPNRVRVLGTLANSREFAAAWNCPAGSPMNPRYKCMLW